MARLHLAEAPYSTPSASRAKEIIYISSDDDDNNKIVVNEQVKRVTFRANSNIEVSSSTSSGDRTVVGLSRKWACNGPHVDGSGQRWTGWDESIRKSRPEENDSTEHGGSASAAVVHDAPDTQITIQESRHDTFTEVPQRLLYWIRDEPGRYWSHTLYRGPQNAAVNIIYCKNRAESENAARSFLKEPVVGFDMEWKSRGARGIKGNISLIQVAGEDKIALFHLALHSGTSVSELLARSLRKLIESPSIAKTGVAINNADGQRLRRYMRLEPRGMFELSFLHRVVKYGHRKPELVNKKLVKLTYLAQDHLGRPLHKGPVRTSDWTKPLSQTQIDYAASDAYAGFRLYHAMETKRLRMSPVPPRPAFAELSLPLQLRATTQDNPSKQDVQPSIDVTGPSQSVPAEPLQGNAQAPAVKATSTTDMTAKRALSALKALRKRMSLKTGTPELELATNELLESIVNAHIGARASIDETPAYTAWQVFLSRHEVDLIAFLWKHAPLSTACQLAIHSTSTVDQIRVDGSAGKGDLLEPGPSLIKEDDDESGESDDEPPSQVTGEYQSALVI